jgi:hypothetical protein
MQDVSGFLGEIEFGGAGSAGDLTPLNGFGQFEGLPYIQRLHELAHEFSDVLELMPYQKAGEGVKLLISVYIEPRLTNGRIIAVLVREAYPTDRPALASLMQLALKRMETLVQIRQQFKEPSIASAREALFRLSQKILAFWPDQPIRSG